MVKHSSLHFSSLKLPLSCFFVTIIILIGVLFLPNHLSISSSTHSSSSSFLSRISGPQNLGLSTTNSSASPIKLNFTIILSGTDFNETNLSHSVVVDLSGNIYVTGSTDSSTFPTLHAFNSSNSGRKDVFISKFTKDGILLFSTYFGGSNDDEASSIAVASDGSIFITGYTFSSNFPTRNAFDSTFNGIRDIFIAKFSSSGQLLFSTYFGGNGLDETNDLVLDSSGNCFISGSSDSSNFPIKTSANSSVISYFNATWDGFIAEFSSTGNFYFSRILGGNSTYSFSSIAVDTSDNVYLVGKTSSVDFPLIRAFNLTDNYSINGFVAKFDVNGRLLFSMLLGPIFPAKIVLQSDKILIAGLSSSEKLIFNHTYNSSNYDSCYHFVIKFSSNGELLDSSALGGGLADYLTSLTIDPFGSYYIAGITRNPNFLIKNPYNSNSIQRPVGTIYSVSSYIAGFNSSGQLTFSTIFGIQNDYISSINANSGSLIISGYSTHGKTQNLYNLTIKIFIAGFSILHQAKFSSLPFSHSSVQNSSSIQILSSNSIFFDGVALSIIIISCAVFFVEYSKNVKSNVHSENDNKKSAQKHFKSRNNTKKDQSTKSSLVSDEIFDLLEEIEKENRPESD